MRFLKGLEVFGSNWKHVQYVVKTRSIGNIQAHANSFFKREKSLGTRTGEKKTKRSIHDINVEKLREAEEKLGTLEGFVWELETSAASDERKKRKTSNK